MDPIINADIAFDSDFVRWGAGPSGREKVR
ncbi:hypothetical protein FHS61_001607 [Altererythrobacter atlanticus]|uniref:Uncharacterized protein n=1 Tax=Croceibacterium atlanticum TaxID=1267766 RepID=A0A0F7KKH5_9SPHN|nr:hypothetical protein WYH_00016 [Croceibacterium atlanticum]MBB5732598.1 hypothetical protein [Croceibacterium atlanticum]